MIHRISTAEQCRALDRQVIKDWGVSGLSLMELASRGVADCVKAHFHEAARRGVLVLCGAGNNGGDGYGAARWLHLAGYPVRTWPLGEQSAGDALMMRASASAVGVPEVTGPGHYGLVIDAVFGTGLKRPIEDGMKMLLDGLSDRAKVLAVDIPSGMCANTGEILGGVLAANRTVTFGRLKPAFFSTNAHLAGAVECIDIGVHPTALTTAELVQPRVLATAWPSRPKHTYKNQQGHLAIIAGSEEMAGAAVLTALGAAKSGVGLITLFTPRSAMGRMSELPASVMIHPCEASDAFGSLDRYDAIVVGPGLGGGRPLPPLLIERLTNLFATSKPMVADADALIPVRTLGPNIVRTPHIGEAARLLSVSTEDAARDRFETARKIKGITLLKGQHTLVSCPAGITVNTTGSPVLATAGSGDVLAGFIGGLLARGVQPVAAARIGAWVHGRSGEILGRTRIDGWSASDIAASLVGGIDELLDSTP